eukprot:scaffold13317_cov92-Alexandrium_tamarense.AAC.10
MHRPSRQLTRISWSGTLGLQDCTVTDRRVRTTICVQTSLALGKLGLEDSFIEDSESTQYRIWLHDTFGMTVSVERCPSPNFVTDVMILHSTQYDVEDDIRGEISRRLWEEFGYELLPTDSFVFLQSALLHRKLQLRSKSMPLSKHA